MNPTLSILAALVVLGSAEPPPATPAPAPLGEPPRAGSLFRYPERIPQPDGRLVAAERGMLFVPMKRDDPQSDVIGIEIYRFAAHETAAPDTPPIFLLHGGPGFEGLEPRLEDDADFYAERIRPFLAIADLVVVGQRGIGSSKPNTRCENRGGLFGLMACKGFWEGQGFDLSGLNVIEAAADVRDVASALGYDRITLSGHSFGSHWAMAVMREHPAIVQRTVLSGVEGPDHTYDMPSGVLRALRGIASAAERSPQLAGQVPEGGLIAALESVISRAEDRPLQVTVADPDSAAPREFHFGASDIRRMALGYTGRVSSRRGIATWPADIVALHRGDYGRAARASLRRSDGDRFRTASFWMLDCSSGISTERRKRLDEDPAADVVGPLGGFYDMSCPTWQADLGEDFRAGFDTDIPTLIVHGTWDVNTPFDNALELAPRFARGRLVPVVGGSHGALLEALDASETFRDAWAAFLRSGELEGMPEEVVLPPVDWEVPKEEP